MGTYSFHEKRNARNLNKHGFLVNKHGFLVIYLITSRLLHKPHLQQLWEVVGIFPKTHYEEYHRNPKVARHWEDLPSEKENNPHEIDYIPIREENQIVVVFFQAVSSFTCVVKWAVLPQYSSLRQPWWPSDYLWTNRKSNIPGVHLQLITCRISALSQINYSISCW